MSRLDEERAKLYNGEWASLPVLLDGYSEYEADESRRLALYEWLMS